MRGMSHLLRSLAVSFFGGAIGAGISEVILRPTRYRLHVVIASLIVSVILGYAAEYLDAQKR